MGENYYSFHKQEWKTITRLAAKQVRMHVNRAHIDWVHVMHIQAQARKRLIMITFGVTLPREWVFVAKNFPTL